jgi:hypothetical protein
MNDMKPCTHLLTRYVHLALLLIVLFGSQGCYHFRVTAPQPNPATEYEQRTVHVLFWGLLQQDTPASDCASNALDEVVTTTNLGYLLISVATVGIWVPMQVKWRCAKESLQEGEPIGQWRGRSEFEYRTTLSIQEPTRNDYADE